MKYYVVARDDWDSTLQKRFGDYGSIHDLSDADVVEAIIQFGRAEITDTDSIGYDRKIEFQNGYD